MRHDGSRMSDASELAPKMQLAVAYGCPVGNNPNRTGATSMRALQMTVCQRGQEQIVVSDVLELVERSFSDVVSLALWHSGAVQICTETPYTLTSGNRSPLYVDCRAIISEPHIMDAVVSAFHLTWVRRGLPPGIVAGGETAGIVFAGFLASRLSRPMVYVRKRPKTHGGRSLVEGRSVRDREVILVEDLVTDGGSKLEFIAALRGEGAIVNHCLVLFDREQGGGQAMAAQGVRLHSVASITSSLQLWREQGLIANTDHQDVESYLRDPREWHRARHLNFKE